MWGPEPGWGCFIYGLRPVYIKFGKCTYIVMVPFGMESRVPPARELLLDCKFDAVYSIVPDDLRNCFTKDVLTSSGLQEKLVKQCIYPLIVLSSVKSSSTNTISLNVKMLFSVYGPRCNYNRQHLSPNYNTLAPLRMYELLNSNDPPIPAERVHLENAISRNRGVLSKLQDQITEARAVLDGLLEEEAHVQDTIESCETIVHPIRDLPEDIIRQCFVASLDTDREQTHSLNGRFAPLILSQVCREWRTIALSTCRLWSSLRLDFDLYHNDVRCLYLLQAYLLRSGMHDITLSIHSKTYLPNSHLIPILISSAPRWTDLSLSVTHNSINTFSAARGTFHRLSRLSLEVIGHIPRALTNSARCTFNAFECAPLLCSFTLQHMRAAVREISLPWSQLKEYTGDDRMSSYIAILKRAPDMERASLQCNGESEYDHADQLTLSHRHLRVLHLHEAEDPTNSRILSEGGIVRLLSFIEFPALESLSMSYMHTYIRVPRTLPGSTAGGLRSLSIDAPFVISAEAQANLLTLLQTMPSLSNLSMSCRFAPEGVENDGIFLGLNANIYPDVLPNLSALTFRFINLQASLSPLFIDMVQSRRHATISRVALRTLHLLTPYVLPADTDAAARWKGMCDEGFVTFSEHR